MKPACHNREAFTDPNAGWFDTGRVRDRWLVEWGASDALLQRRPIYRYRHPWFTDRCTVHDKADIGPGQTYAEFFQWDCSGCKHKPEGV